MFLKKAIILLGNSPRARSLGETPKHRHGINSYTATGGNNLTLLDQQQGLQNGFKEITCGFAGGDAYHNNLSPATTVYAWRRQA